MQKKKVIKSYVSVKLDIMTDAKVFAITDIAVKCAGRLLANGKDHLVFVFTNHYFINPVNMFFGMLINASTMRCGFSGMYEVLPANGVAHQVHKMQDGVMHLLSIGGQENKEDFTQCSCNSSGKECTCVADHQELKDLAEKGRHATLQGGLDADLIRDDDY